MESEDAEYEDEEYEDEDGDLSLMKLKEGASRRKGRGLDDSAVSSSSRGAEMGDYDELDDDEGANFSSAAGPGSNTGILKNFFIWQIVL